MIFLILFLRLVVSLIVNKGVNIINLFTLFLAFIFLYVKIKIVRGGYMAKSGMYGHFRMELLVVTFVLFVSALFVFPNAKKAYSKIKLNSAIDGATSYKETVDNYFASQLLSDNNFKADGTYFISYGKLVSGDVIYNILMGGNVPDNGYLNYSNNSLVDGCIGIDGYSVIVEDGNITALKGSCDRSLDVALGI